MSEQAIQEELVGPPSLPRRVTRIVVRLVAIPYLIIVLLLCTFQRWLIYPGSQLQLDDSRLDSIATRFETFDVSVPTRDGLILGGWLMLAIPNSFPGRMVASDNDILREKLATERPLILYLPGNDGHRYHRIILGEAFAQSGFDTLLVDYRGYGGNPGAPTQDHLIADAHAVWNYLTDQLHVSHDRIFLFGESLGGGVAVPLAAHQCEQQAPPGGLILRSTFSSLVDAAAKHYPVFPVRLLIKDRYDSLKRIGKVTCPILSIHGDEDRIVPLELGEKLFAAAPPASAGGYVKRLVVLSGVDHNQVPLEAIQSEIEQAIESWRRPEPR